ncbi:MAG TPA: TonB-dependent receptor, partial [Bryobacteraceae bacterium]|nr:TonB-dependent receptor [Bryobacteraceae bacterium]
GDYRIEASHQGFKRMTRTGVRVDANAMVNMDLNLEVGEVSERVTVSAEAPTVNTESQAIGNSRYEVQLKNLPIIVREVQALVGQTAGVPYGTTDTVGGSFQQGGRSAMQVLSDGTQLNPLQTTAWPAIDGIGRRADLTIPGIDSIAEVRWVTSGGSAEYSQPTQVIVASKSGTNAYHGNAFESYRSGGLGARRWEAANRESFVRHQFGGTLGGPIRRDRMFFFGGADIFRHTSGSVLNARYPTDAERSGDLSGLLGRTDPRGAPAPIVIYDPLTRQPFPGNIIPRGRLSPVALELLKMIPTAPAPARLTDFNAIFYKPLKDNSEKYDARFDYNISASDRLFARATLGHLDQASRFNGSVPGDYGYSTKNEWTHAAATNWTHILSPSTVAVFQFTFRSMPFKNLPSHGGDVFPVKIADLDPKAPFAGPPAIVIASNGAGISELVDRLLFNYSADYGYTFDPNVTKTIGNHTVKTGFTFLRGYKTQELASPPYGRFTTASDFNNPNSSTSATGDAFGDFLLGYPATTDVTIGPAGGFLSKTNFAGFVQDDWKMTQKLTLNLGLRYDRFGFFEEMNKRASGGNFRLGKILIPQGSEALIQPSFQPFTDRYMRVDQAGLPSTFIQPNNHDFAPRLGLAYRAPHDLVIRGGFGIYFTDITYNEFQDEMNAPPFTRRAQLSRSLLISQGVDVNSAYTFQNPTANGSTAGAANSLSSIGGFAESYPSQRAYTWNVTLEKPLGGNMAARASYLGNKTRHMSRSLRLNACPPGSVECLSRPAGDPTGRKWTQFDTTLGRHAADGEANYHSVEVELTRRFSNGFLFDVNYAHSRLLGYQFEATNPVAAPLWKYDYGPVSAQPNDIFHWNYVMDLPVGRGHRFGSHMNRMADILVGGWMLSGLGTWQSGVPLTVTAASGQSPTGATSNRADRIASGRLDHANDSRGAAAYKWFDPSAYVLPGYVDASATRPARRFGTAGIGTVIGPSFFTYDMTLQKRFAIHERWNLQTRIEAFNPFNIPMLGNPDLEVTSANFARIRTSNPNYTPRNIQLGVRLEF